MRIKRRDLFIGTGAGIGTAALSGAALAQRGSADTLIGVTWGGPQLDSVKPMAAEWAKAHPPIRVAWEVHEGSSSAVVGKLRATWPNPKLNLLHVNDPAVHLMNAEGWLETVDDVPNIKNVSNSFVLRNAQGQAIAVPHCAGAVCWGYRPDLVDGPINSLADLLEPRFRGKIGFRDVNSWSGLPLVSIALELGGSERNVEPAFDFLAKLAKSGAIVNVGKSNADVVNSLNMGVSAVAFAGATEWNEVAKTHKIKLLNRVPGSKALKSYYTLVHWAIPKSPQSAAAKDLANTLLGTENDTIYARATGTAPANKDSQLSNPIGILLEQGELKEFGYFCDFGLMARSEHGWTDRFDTEIRPLLRQT
jgi:putative spermidine/putrescine transport system substrate-binding protein